MLISFTFSYLENFFVVVYLSFSFVLAQDASARDTRTQPTQQNRTIVQSSSLSVSCMFALLHCTFTITGDKQCACCIHSKQEVYVYTLFFELILSFPNSSFYIAPRSKRGIPTFIIYCVSCHFLIIT